MDPTFEVKFLLQPSVVVEGQLAKSVISVFNMPTAGRQIGVQFLDTNDKSIYRKDWSPRIRAFQDKDEYELTYKKRYPITGIDMGGVEDALSMARNDGFSRSGKKFKSQVEWGFSKMVLSITREKSTPKAVEETNPPNQSSSREMLIDEAPDKFLHWDDVQNWGRDALEQSRIFGPVPAARWTGEWDGLEIDIEIWPIRSERGCGEVEYVVEASFKVEGFEEASVARKKFLGFLQVNGWLLEKDSLKTRLVMERY